MATLFPVGGISPLFGVWNTSVCVPVKTDSWIASFPSVTATLIAVLLSGNASCQRDQNMRPISRPWPVSPPGALVPGVVETGDGALDVVHFAASRAAAAALESQVPATRARPGHLPWHSPAGVLVRQALPRKLLPEPVPSQNTSGSLCKIRLPWTRLPAGAVPVGSARPEATTTPPWKSVSAEGTFQVILLPSILTPFAPHNPTPTPDSGCGSSSLSAHALVLLRMLLPARWNSPAGPGRSARTPTPVQLPWIEFATTLPCSALRMRMPNRLPELSLPMSVASAAGESPM